MALALEAGTMTGPARSTCWPGQGWGERRVE